MMLKLLFGAVAGAVSAFVFTVIHDLIISNIWFMLIPMLIAGALCGICISWSYALLVKSNTASAWARYNALWLVLLYLLAPISLLLFEPVISIPELVASNAGLPDEMVRIITPFVIVYTVTMSIIVTALYGRHWKQVLAVLITCGTLMLLLGMNIAALGLVYLTSGWIPMLLKQVALIVGLNVVYALVFWGLSSTWSEDSIVQSELAA